MSKNKISFFFFKFSITKAEYFNPQRRSCLSLQRAHSLALHLTDRTLDYSRACQFGQTEQRDVPDNSTCQSQLAAKSISLVTRLCFWCSQWLILSCYRVSDAMEQRSCPRKKHPALKKKKKKEQTLWLLSGYPLGSEPSLLTAGLGEQESGGCASTQIFSILPVKWQMIPHVWLHSCLSQNSVNFDGLFSWFDFEIRDKFQTTDCNEGAHRCLGSGVPKTVRGVGRTFSSPVSSATLGPLLSWPGRKATVN